MAALAHQHRRFLERHYPAEAAMLAQRHLAARIKNVRIPERATVVDPEPKPPEADCRAVDGAGSSSEAVPAERGGGSATSLSRTPGDTGKAGRAGGMGGNPMPPEWRAARRTMRQAGHVVEQHEGIVYVDGRRSEDRSLYP